MQEISILKEVVESLKITISNLQTTCSSQVDKINELSLCNESLVEKLLTTQQLHLDCLT